MIILRVVGVGHYYHVTSSVRHYVSYRTLKMDQSHRRIPILERVRRFVNWLGFESNLWFFIYLFCLFYFFKFYRSDFTRDLNHMMLPTRHSEPRKKLSFGNIPPRRK